MWQIALLLSAAALVLLAGYALLVEPAWLRVRRRLIHLEGWDPALDGLTILHLSDLHIGGAPGRADRLLRQAGRLPADLIAITGDFIAGPEGLGRCCQLLREVADGREVFGVPGNHEHEHYASRSHPWGRWKTRSRLDTPRIVEALEGSGVTMLVNQRFALPYGQGKLTLVGLDDLFSKADDLEGTLQDVEAGASVVLLCHSPDVLAEATKRQIPLVLSGHTHGGQVRFPLLGTPSTATRVPLERPSGVIRRGRTVMHISPGLGTSFLPVRFFARPEATLLELRSAASRDALES